MSLSLFATGCTDKALNAEMTRLRHEIESLKSNSPKTSDIESLRIEVASLKAELATSKQRERLGSEAVQNAQRKIEEIGRELQAADSSLRGISQRVDSLVNLLPIEQLSEWKVSGQVTFRQLSLKDPSSLDSIVVTPTSITHRSASGASFQFGSAGETMGLFMKSKSGHFAGVLAGDTNAEFVAMAPDESFSKLFASKEGGGFKSSLKDEEKQGVALFRSATNTSNFLFMFDQKASFIADSRGLEIRKGEKPVFTARNAPRGASVKIFDDVGTIPKILLELRDNNGEPAVAVIGANQFNVLLPKTDNPK